MKAGRVIDGEVHDATLEARRLISAAQAEAAKLLGEARAEGERVTAQGMADAAAARDAVGAPATCDRGTGPMTFTRQNSDAPTPVPHALIRGQLGR